MGRRGKVIAFDKSNVKLNPDNEMLYLFESELLPPPSVKEFDEGMRCMFDI